MGVGAKSIDDKVLGRLIEKANELFLSEPNYIELQSNKPIVFGGDTHGDYRTTQKILDMFFGKDRIVFLGDYVDRAREPLGSIKNMRLLLDAKVKDPKGIILLRGNHEFKDTFSRYGFRRELCNAGLSHLEPAFEELFSNMPYVATTKNGVIALHAGMPDIASAEDLMSIPKGIKDESLDKMVSQLLWNDSSDDNYYDVIQETGPSERFGVYADHYFKKGFAFTYGRKYVEKKLSLLGKKVLLRGHDYSAKGFSAGDKILTIFTSVNYKYHGRFKGVYVARLNPRKRIADAKDLEIMQLEPVEQPRDFEPSF